MSNQIEKLTEGLITVAQLAAMLSVKPSTVYVWAKRRLIPVVILNSGQRKECIRFRPEAIADWIVEREERGKARRLPGITTGKRMTDSREG